MVGKLRRVGAAVRRLPEGAQHGGVEARAAVRVERLLDRQARQLVAEGDTGALWPKHARADTLVERRERIPGDGLE